MAASFSLTAYFLHTSITIQRANVQIQAQNEEIHAQNEEIKAANIQIKENLDEALINPGTWQRLPRSVWHRATG